MIKLEFRDVNSALPYILFQEFEKRGFVEDGLLACHFKGVLSFVVNDVEFHNYLALLYFAKQLNEISQELKAGKAPNYLHEYDSQWTLTFTRQGDDLVLIEQGIDGRPTEILSAEDIVNERHPGILRAVASIDELHAAASQFLYDVFGHCCTIFPPLSQDTQAKQFLGIVDTPNS